MSWSSLVRSTRSIERRPEPQLRVWLVLLLATLLSASCGFHLRGEATYAFTSIYVNAPASPPFASEMRRALAGAAGVTVSEDPYAVQVILDVTTIADDKSVLSLSSGGRVQEFALAKRVVFQVFEKDGRVWLPTREIVVRRTYLYDDTQRLAREIQEGRLLREMQSDLVAQIVRQLQSAKAPA